jgi:dihydrofolate reductase
MMKPTIIVAIDKNNGIGADNRLPWSIPEDLKQFRDKTTGHTVIMGRKTFESLGRVLSNRRNMVITSNPDQFDDTTGFVCVTSIQEALMLAKDDEPFIIGGALIYEQALPYAERLVVTHVDDVYPDCDAFFPPIDPAVWKEVAREDHSSVSMRDVVYYSIVTYERIHHEVTAKPPRIEEPTPILNV